MANVLVVTNMYPPHHYGGYELLCRDTVERFRERGHRVEVLTSDWRIPGVADPPDEEAVGGIRRSLRMYWDDHQLVTPSWRRRLVVERVNQRALTTALEDVGPDVVSVWHMGALSMGLLTTIVERRLPVVAHIGDDWLTYGVRIDPWSRTFARRPRLGWLVRRLSGIPTRLPDLGAAGTWCFVSERTRRFAEERSPWRFPDAPIVPAGVDERDFPVVETVPDRRWGWQLLFTGRIDERKGIDTAIEALPLLPEATLRILGRGDDGYLSQLQRRADDLGVASRVAFGVVDRGELRDWYGAADVFVFPSTWDEPFGIVPLEAMACGTPVIATGRGGSGEFLEHERNCLVFDAGDASSLAAAVRRLHDDLDLRRRVIEGGTETARRLTAERLASTLEHLHVEAAAGRRPAA